MRDTNRWLEALAWFLFLSPLVVFAVCDRLKRRRRELDPEELDALELEERITRRWFT